jgi:hypothetical protein
MLGSSFRRSRLIARFRSVAITWGPPVVRSTCQWRRFSILQCPRSQPAISVAFSVRVAARPWLCPLFGGNLSRCHCIGHGVCPLNGWSWMPVAGGPKSTVPPGELGVAEVDVAANVCLAVVSRRLGHSSIALTADTCSYLLTGVDRRAAEAAAALVPRQLPYQSGQKQAPRAKESRRVSPQKCRAARGNAVGPVGLEPTTCGLKVPPRT